MPMPEDISLIPQERIEGLESDLSGKQPTLTSANAGNGISITEVEGVTKISNTQVSAVWGNITGTLADQTDLNTALEGKVVQTNVASKVYGTDAQGAQTTYDVTSFGAVDDVKVGTSSVVANKIATLGTMAGENTTSYYTKTDTDILLDTKLTQYSEFPAATLANVNKIAQYIGQSNTNYTNGYVYKNIATHTYTATTNFDSSSVAGTVVTISNSDFVDFVLKYISDPTEVVRGKIGYDGPTSYSVTLYNDVEIIKYIVETITDLEADGFIFSPYLATSDELDFTCTISIASSTYAWTRIDVQPRPVTSVNGKYGDVVLTATDIGYGNTTVDSALDNKVDKITSGTKIYATSNGSQTSLDYGTSVENGYIVQRGTTDGQIAVPQTPTADAHATSKKYVDDKVSSAITEAVVFKGIVADETLLPSSGNNNGDMYWITAFSSNPPSGIVAGRSGAAIYVVTNNVGAWQYTQDAIYQPDDQSITLDANGKLKVMVSAVANNSITVKSDGLHVDISGKQDELVSGTNIKTINNTSLLGSGDITIQSVPSLDDVTVNTNASDELQAIGTLNKNTASGATAVKYDWVGTLAQWQAGRTNNTIPDSWVCYITDDSTTSSSAFSDNISITRNSSNQLQTIGVINQNNNSVALKQWSGTKAQYDSITTKDDNTLYNVTDDIAPTAILLNQVASDLNGKADVDLSNVVPLLPRFTLLYNGSVSKNNTVTFSDDPDNYDLLIGYRTDVSITVRGRSYNGRIKLAGPWVGVDSLDGGFYSQLYSLDFGRSNGNTFICWNNSWTATNSISANQHTSNYKIYGIKIS